MNLALTRFFSKRDFLRQSLSLAFFFAIILYPFYDLKAQLSEVTLPNGYSSYINQLAFNLGDNMYVGLRGTDNNADLVRFDGQSFTVIPTPTGFNSNAYGGYSASVSPVVIGSNAYLLYIRDSDNSRTLFKFDGTALTEISAPAGLTGNGYGYYGDPIAVGSNVYFRYRATDNDFYLVKYDGTSLTQISNSVGGTYSTYSDRGYYGDPFVIGSNLFLRYYTDAGNFPLVKYDGTTLSAITLPSGYTNASMGFQGVSVTFGSDVYLQFRNNDFDWNLVKMDGTTFALTVIDNPTGYDGFNLGFRGTQPIVFESNLYMQYFNTSFAGVLMKYDGTSFTAIDNPSGFGSSSFKGYNETPIIVGSDLFLRYRDDSDVYHIAKYDGTDLSIITTPAEFSATYKGYEGSPLLVDSKLYLRYSKGAGMASIYDLVIYDGSSLNVVTAPSGYTGDYQGVQSNPILFQNTYFNGMNGDNGERFFKYLPPVDPSITSSLSGSFAENGNGTAYTVEANGASTITYSLGSGNDENLFGINGSTGAVTFNSAPDFENPGDANTDNAYVINVIATDEASNSANQDVIITVTDVNENRAPTFTSTAVTSVLDNQTYSYTPTATDADNDALTYSATTKPSWISLTTEAQGEVTTFAGGGNGSQQDGTGTSAVFASPKNVATDASGNIYVAESGIGGTPLIRKISLDGVVSTLAGGASGYVDGTGTAAGFIRPFGIAIDASNNIYVSDGSTARTIRKITPDGVVTTFAGSNGNVGTADGTGTSATFTSPVGMDFDSNGNLFVADNFNIRKITPQGVVTTFAGTGSSGSADGNGTTASFNSPIGIAIDASDNLYVSDYFNYKIRKITPSGEVSTFAGSGSEGSQDGTGTNASFYFPFGLTFDNAGNLYVADWANEKIRKITPGGVVSTLAGSGTTGSQDGIGTSASFNYPDGIAFNIDNAIYVGDDGNNLVRRVSLGNTKLTGDPTGQLGDHSVLLRVDDSNGGTAEQSFVIAVTAANAAPVVDLNGPTAGIDNANNYNENSEIKFAAAGTVSDLDGDNIVSMIVTVANSTQSNDDHYVAMDFQATAEKTAATNAGVTISLMSNGVMNITGSASAQIYQDILQNLIYGNSSDVPPAETFNIEVVVNDGTVNSASASSAITIIPLNDGSSAFGTAANPTFTEGGAAVTLFTNMTGHTQEAGETITGFKFTITNVTSNAGADEKLTVDGTAIALNNGNSGTTSGNSLSYSVALAGSTATVTLSGGTFTASAFGTLTEGVKYENINQNPANASRVVTLSEVTDSGAQGAGHDNPWATSHASSTVSVTPVNDPSVFTSATTANFAENGTGTAYTITATDVESTNFTYALGTANDSDKFNITNNLVTFKTAPDFETPTDGDGNNTYVLEVKVTEDGITVNQNVTITVTDVQENTAPVVDLDGATSGFINENGSIGIADYATITDADNDNIVSMTVTVTGYTGTNTDQYLGINGATNTIATNAGVTVGAYDTNTGILSVTGSATPAIYTSILNGIVYGNTSDTPPAGDVTIHIEVNDGTVKSSDVTNTITITPVNDEPVFTSQVVTSVNEGAAYTYNFAATDADGDALAFTTPTTPSWLSLVNAPGVIGSAVSTFVGNGTSGNQNGTGTNAILDTPVSFTIDANGNLYALTKSGEIKKITPQGVVSTYLSQVISGITDASSSQMDIDSNGNIYYTVGDATVMKVTPQGVSSTFIADPRSGKNPELEIIAGGNYFVIDNNDVMYFRSFSGFLKIDLNTNQVTEIFANGSPSMPERVGEDNQGNIILTLIDLAGVANTMIQKLNGDNSLTLLLDLGAPTIIDDLVFDAAGNMIFVDKAAHLVKTYNATDGVVTLAGGAGQSLIDGTGTSAGFNKPISVEIDNSQNLYVLDVLNHAIRKIEANAGQQSLSGTAPANAGTHNVVLKADDSNGGTIEQSFTITVNDVTAPTFSTDPFPPTINATSILMGLGLNEAGKAYYVVLADGATAPTAAEVKAGTGSAGAAVVTSANAAITDPNGSFSHSFDVTGLTDITDYDIYVIAEDAPAGNLQATPFLLEIKTIDGTAPAFSSATTAIFAENGTGTAYTVAATDVNAVTYALGTGNDEVLFEINGGVVTFINAPDFETPGDGDQNNSYVINVIATDAAGNAANQDVTISVTNENDNDPVFNSQAITSVNENVNYRYEFDVTDADGGQPTVTATTAPSWLSIQQEAGQVSVVDFVGDNTKADADGTGTNAIVSFNTALATDASGNIYSISGGGLRQVTPAGVVTTISNAFNGPDDGLAIDSNGNFYVADEKHVIRKVTPQGVVSDFVGKPETSGDSDGSTSDARFNNPNGLAISASGDLYIADGGNGKIKKATPGQVVTTIANVTSPHGVAVDASGTIYATSGFAIVKIENESTVTVLAGDVSTSGDVDGSGTAARFGELKQLTLDSQGNIYVADAGNYKYKKITPAGEVTTHVSNPGGQPMSAIFDNSGNLVLGMNHWIRKVVSSTGAIVLSGDPAGHVGVHNVTLTADDGEGRTSTQDFTVTVNDVSTPVLTSLTTASFAENGTGAAYTVAATDANTLTYSLGTGNDESLFDINGASGAVTFNSSPDFENAIDGNTDNAYIIEVKASDGTNTATQSVTITVTNENDNDPIFNSQPVTSVDEDVIYSYTFNATDADGTLPTVTATTAPSWLSIQQEAGEPSVADFVGDGGKSDYNGTGTNSGVSDVWSMTIAPNNDIFAMSRLGLRKITSAGVVTTFASSLNQVASGIARDGNGNFYVTQQNHYIKKIDAQGSASDFAGKPDTAGDSEGTGSDARFTSPQGIVINADGDFYIADSGNGKIKKMTPSQVVTEIATLSSPTGITVDPSGNIFVTSGHAVYKITGESSVTLFAGDAINSGNTEGTGAVARFYEPHGLISDDQGNIYVADKRNYSVRKITPAGEVSTVVSSLSLAPFTLVFDSSGSLFVGGQHEINKVTFGSGNLVLTGDPSGEAGVHNVTLIADDGEGRSTTQDFTVTVNDVTAPTVTNVTFPDDGYYKEGKDLFFSVEFSETVILGGTSGSAVIILPSFDGPTAVADYESGSGSSTLVFKHTVQSGEYNPGDFTLGSIEFFSGDRTIKDAAGNDATYPQSLGSAPNVFVDATLPSFTSAATANFVENGTGTAYTIAATDNATITYGLGASNDETLFDINGGIVTFKSAPDFETPGDGDQNNSYVINVIATDAAGNAANQEVTITVTNVNDNDPVFTSQGITSVNEGEAYNYNILVNDLDGDQLTITSPTIPSWLSLKNEQGGIGSEVSTFAGNGSAGNQNGTGTDAILDTPISFTIDANGNLYTLAKHGEIKKISPQGVVTTYLTQVLNGISDTNASQMDFDSNGNLYFSVGEAVMKVTPQGVLSDYIADLRTGKNPEVMIIGGGEYFVIDNNDVLYLRGLTGFFKIDLNTNQVTQIFETSSPLMPERIGMDNQGNIILTLIDLAGVANTTIQKLNGDNSLTLLLDLGAPTIIEDLIFDAAGNMIFVDKAAHLVKTYNATDGILTLAGGAGQSLIDGEGTNAGFNKPMSLEIDNAQNLYVLDVLNHAIRKISALEGAIVLSGTAPLTTGNHNVVLRANDGNGRTADQSFTITVNDITAPVFTSGTSENFVENGTGIAYTVAATDANAVTYALGTGNDEALFDINGGVVTFKSAPDFETPRDGDQNNSYVINVIATDAAGNVTNQNVTITVTNVDDTAPVISSATVVDFAENATGVAYTIVATDDNSITYSLGTGNDVGFVSLNGAEVSFDNSPDFETKSSYVINVIATDALGFTANQDVTITITDVDEVSPTVVITTEEADPSSSSSFEIQLTFSESVTSSLGSGTPLVEESVSNDSPTDVGTILVTEVSTLKGTVDDRDIDIWVLGQVSGTVTFQTSDALNVAAVRYDNDQYVNGIDIRDADFQGGGTASFSGDGSGYYAISVRSTNRVFLSYELNMSGDGLTASTGALSADMFTLTNATVGNITSVSRSVYTADVTPIADGAVSVALGAGVVQDDAGNDLIAPSALTLTHDITGPTVLITTGESNPTNASSFEISVDFSEPISTEASLSTLNETEGNDSWGEGGVITVTEPSILSGSVSSDRDFDNWYLGNITGELKIETQTSGIRVTLFGGADPGSRGSNLADIQTGPGTINYTTDGSTNYGIIVSSDSRDPIPYEIQVTGAALGAGASQGLSTESFTLTNATLDNLVEGNNNAYTADITPIGEGDVEVSLAANTVTDVLGNSNSASNTLTIAFDGISPVFTSATAVNFVENGSGTAYTISATDINNITYSLGSGNDEPLFGVDGTTGAVIFNNAPDFESPADGGGDNSYVINVIATDAAGNATNQNVTVTVTNVDDSPPVISSATVVDFAENATGVAYTIVATDDNNITYSLGTGNDEGSVSLNGAEVSFDNSPDFETKSSYVINMIATDALGNAAIQSVTIRITDVDEVSPTVVITTEEGDPGNSSSFEIQLTFSESVESSLSGSLSFEEAEPNDTPTGAGTISVTETSTISGTAGGTDVDIWVLGQISGEVIFERGIGGDLKYEVYKYSNDQYNDGTLVSTFTSAIGSFEGDGLHYYAIQVSESRVTPRPYVFSMGGEGLNSSGALSPELFTLTNATVNNILAISPTSYTADVTPLGDGAVSVSLAAGVVQDEAGNDLIASGTLTLTHDKTAPTLTITSEEPIITNSSSFEILVSSSEPIGGGSETFTTLNETELNDRSTDAGIQTITGPSILKGSAGGRGREGDPGDYWNLASVTGEVVIETQSTGLSITVFKGSTSISSGTGPTTINFNADGSSDYSINLGGSTNTAYEVRVTGAALGASQGLSTASFTLTNATIDNLVEGNDNTFTADVTPLAEGVIEVSLAAEVVEDAAGNHNTASNTLMLTYDGIDPVFSSSTSVNFAENGTGTAYTATATDNSALIFTLGIGNDETLFEINGGAVTFINAPDFETPSDGDTDNDYVINVIATDEAGNAVNQDVTITVTNVDDTDPVFTSATTVNFAENGTSTVYTITATDANALSYTLSTGNDETLFEINGGVVTFRAAPNFETPSDSNTDNDYVINVVATDAAGNAANQDVTITVTDVNDISPVFSTIATQNVAENTTAVATLAATDGDAGSNITFSKIGGADESLFTLTGSVLTFSSAPNFEAPADANTDNDYVVEVQATDGTNTTDLTITVSVTDVNEDSTAPVFTSANAVNFTENGSGTAYTIAATDENAITYSFGTGNDEGLFNISGGVVTFKNIPDFETPVDGNTDNAYVINVIATDAVNNSANQNVTITVTNVDDTAPVFTSANAVNFAENGTGTAYTIAATDANAITYSLGTGNDEALFNITGGIVTFNSTPDFETPVDGNTDNAYIINVKATDVANNSSNQNVTIMVINLDEFAPVITSLDPLDEATVTSNQTLRVTFGELIKKGTGFVRIVKESNGDAVQTIDIQSGAVLIDGNTAIIDPPTDLPEGEDLSILIDGTALLDRSDNDITGVFNNTTWNHTVTTADVVGPQLVSLSPEDGSNVEPKSIVTATFNESIFPNSGRMRIYRKSDLLLLRDRDITSNDLTFSGNTVSLQLPPNLALNEEIVIHFSASSIVDASGNEMGVQFDDDTWNVTPVIDQAAELLTLSPADGGTVNPGNNVTATFNETVVKGTGKVRIYRKSDVSLLSEINITDPAITVNGAQVSFNLPPTTPVGQEVIIHFAGSTLKDLGDNDINGVFDNDTWNLNVVSDPAPAITSLSPVDGGSFVPGDILTLTLSENVTKNSGKIRVYRSSNNDVLGSIDVTSSDISVSGNVITVQTPTGIPAGESVFIHFAPATFVDSGNNNLSGLFNTETWNLTSAVDPPPSISTLSPVDGGNLNAGFNIAVTFSEDVFKNNGKVRFYRANDVAVLATMDITNPNIVINGGEVTITPPANLPANEEMFVHFSSSSLRDSRGNDISGLFSTTTWNLTLIPDPSPTISNLSPADEGTILQGGTARVTFSETVLKRKGKVRIYKKGDVSLLSVLDVASSDVTVNGSEVSVVLPRNLIPGEEIFIHFSSSSLEDSAGNDMSGLFDADTWNLTVQQDLAPIISSLSPSDGGTTIPEANITATFSEDVFKNDGKLRIYKKNDLTLLHSVDINNAGVTVSGSSLSMALPAGLPEGEELLVHLNKDALIDAGGNNIQGLFTVDTWNFTINAGAPPEVNAEEVTLPKQEEEPLIELIEVEVYPNPTTGRFILAINDPAKVKAIVILDMLGKPVFIQTDEVEIENQIDITQEANGVYLVNVQHQDGVKRIKIMLRK